MKWCASGKVCLIVPELGHLLAVEICIHVCLRSDREEFLSFESETDLTPPTVLLGGRMSFVTFKHQLSLEPEGEHIVNRMADRSDLDYFKSRSAFDM